jgi:hypothetical protein
MRLNSYEIGIIVVLMFLIFGVGYNTHPLTKAQPQKVFEDRIEDAKMYYEEAKALSISMPLLNDSAVNVISDSLMVVLIELNHSWVIYVRTQEGFEKYTEEISTLNRDIGIIRTEYEVAKGMRVLMKDLRRITPRLKKKEKFQKV